MQQLRHARGISVTSVTAALIGGVIVFTATGVTALGRTEVASGAVTVENLISDIERQNAYMTAETKAKSRLTLDLAGIGIEEEPLQTLAQRQPEPVMPAAPQVDHAPAQVLPEDPRKERVATRLVPPLTAVQAEAGAALQVLIDAKHEIPEPQPEKMANEIAAQHESQAEAARHTPAPTGLFDFSESFNSAPAPAPEPVQAPAQPVVAPQAATAGDQLDARIAGGETGIPKIPDSPETRHCVPAEKCTPVQFKAFTVRCTKLVRDILPKISKEAPGLLHPFIKRKLETKEIQDAAPAQWEALLTMLESTPASAMLGVLKGK